MGLSIYDTWRCKVLRLSPSERLSLLFRVEGPVLRHVVPDVPEQVVGVVLHRRNLLQDDRDAVLVLLTNAI